MDATQICGLLDADLVTFIHNIIVLLKIAVPIILVIFGMLDFAKGVIANKEDEIKKGQQTFIKRLIAAACVFFVVTIVQLVMGFISKDDTSFWSCADQILNGTAGTKYEPTAVNKKNNGSGGSNENVFECRSTIPGIKEEYKYCLSVADNKLCNTIFQRDCGVEDASKLWSYNNYRGLDEAIEGYTCKSGSGNHDNIYRRALFSCVTDNDNNRYMNECASLMQPFCSKDN